MGPRRIPGILVAVCLFAGAAMGQEVSPATPAQTPPPGYAGQQPVIPRPAQANAQGSTYLQQSLTAVTGQSQLSDVTLTGSIIVMKGGSPLESGTITLEAIGDTEAQVTMTMPSGTRTEVRSISSLGVPAEIWTGPDGTVKRNPSSSLLTPHPAWFLPALVMTAQPISQTGSSFVASETRNGVPVNHLQVWQLPGGASTIPDAILQSQTQYDLYLDPATSLPTSMVFYVQPDYPKPAIVYVPKDTRAPVEMRFSSYQLVQGHPVAFHIQVFIQGRQMYDIQLSSAAFNTNPAIASAN